MSGSLRWQSDMHVGGICLSLLLALVPAMWATPVFSASYQIIHNFTGMSMGDGDTPIPELVVDNSGRLYGTTQFGGKFGYGSIFRLTKPAIGSKKWTEKILYSFASSEGNDPKGGVLVGPSGELYGTTYIGGTYNAGSVYRLDGGTLTTLHAFSPQNNDGYYSIAGLAFGADGLLYGTTTSGATPNDGIVFSVSPQGDGIEYAIIHNFGNTGDGALPYYGRVSTDNKGVLVGTTFEGGAYSSGVIFQLTPPAGGKVNWKERLLHSFGAPGLQDATFPVQSVTRGGGGVFYGCASGGTHGLGAVYALTPPPQGSKIWSESVLYNFGDQNGDPVVDECAVAVNSSGSLFGTASGGGAYGEGAFFELDLPTHGGTVWTEQVLHSFGPESSPDGLQPYSGPTRSGTHFYGVTYVGGTEARGTVYEITP